MGMGMGMGIEQWEWEGMGIPIVFPHTSSLNIHGFGKDYACSLQYRLLLQSFYITYTVIRGR